MQTNKELSKIKRRNAKIYPVYKMFAWDLLFFYSIEFLFYTITKKVTTSEVLIINWFYLLFRILMQIPAVTITDFLGKRKSIILGNIMIAIYVLILIIFPGAISIIIADLIFSLRIWHKNNCRNKSVIWFCINKRRRRIIFKNWCKRRKLVLHPRWNSIISSRIFICNKQLYTNIYMLRIYSNINNNII